jgi:rare lipoprotein A (peptidoglycan hydrolase)
MTPNPLAWVSSGVSFLAIAGTHFLGTTWIASTSTVPAPAVLTPHPLAFTPRHEPIILPPRATAALPQRSVTTTPLAGTTALWRCPASLSQQLPSGGRFAVKMQGCTVAYVTDATQAQQLSQRLDRQLQDPQTKWSEVTPHLVGDGLRPTAGHRLTIQQGQHILLSLEPTFARQFNTHPHRLITEWANNIRLVAGVKPLTLTQAQKQMYAVTATPQMHQGAASWYGPYFHGRMTANGEIYNQNDLTAAHRDLPLGTYVQVTNRSNGRSVVVRINDRGPYLDEDYRIIDLSHQAAHILDGTDKGVMPIELVVLKAQPSFPRLALAATAPPRTLAQTPPQTLPQTLAFNRLARDFQDQ